MYVHIHFHGKSRVFYAQSSSQMIRKQGKPDEREREREKRDDEMFRLDCGGDPFSSVHRKNIIALTVRREKNVKLFTFFTAVFFAIRLRLKERKKF